MQLYPAIDIKNGQCVRLTQGLFDNVKVYYNTPRDAAMLWEEMGGSFLHVVDLDGALAGRPVNLEAVGQIIRAVRIPVETGGGIRTCEDVKALLNIGVSRVIIGTRAVESPEFVKQLIEEFGPDKIVLGVDAKDGLVAVEGWEKVSSLTASDLCAMMKGFGIRHIIYTDISRDGMLSGPNVSATKRLTEETGLDVIASGGVSCMEDLQALYEAGIQGAIMGKALYEQKIDLREAVRRFEGFSIK